MTTSPKTVGEVLPLDAEALPLDWTDWSERRPPNAPGRYWWRIPARTIGGVENMRPEWVAEMSLHGMGYGDNEYWPESISHWDGYRRAMPAGLQWRAEPETPKNGERWPGLNIKPCPFCGGTPRLRHNERGSSGGVVICGDKLWTHNNFWLEHSCVFNGSTRSGSLAWLQEAWNRRAAELADQAQ